MSGLSHWYLPDRKNNNHIVAVAETAEIAETTKDMPAEKDNISRISEISNSSSNIIKLDVVPDSYDLEERISIIQHDAGISEAWAEAFARLDCMDRPSSISYKTWQNITNNAGLMLDSYAQDIIAHGWSVADIFGVHKNAPEKRYDAMGELEAMQNDERV